MANAVAKPGSTALAAVQALKGHLQSAAAAIPTTGQEGILQFTKHGDWVIGVDKKEVTVDDLFVVNPMSFHTGFICWNKDDKKWKDGPIAEVKVPLGHPTPLAHELPVHEQGNWQEQSGFKVKFIEGPFKGQEASFSGSSKGALNAVKGLMDAVLARLDTDPVNIVPVVSAGADSYVHKVYGKTYFPVLDIDSWVSMDGEAAEAEADGEAEGETDDVPFDSTEEAAAKVAEQPEEAPAEPARRRRRA